MKDKRGFELAISTMVIIILGLVVLIFLILFFTMGSGSFLEKMKSYFSYSNVDSFIQGCNVFVDSGQVNAYCCDSKKIRYMDDGEKVEEVLSCSELFDMGFEIKELNCDGVC